MRALIVLALCTGVVLATPSTSSAAVDNPVAAENARAGSSGWRLNRSADDVRMQIKGYANLTSVDRGDSIDFHVSVDSPQRFSIEIYRMGWYGGSGGRLHARMGPFDGIEQSAPLVDPATGMVATDWTPSAQLQVPMDWVSGAYLARLIRADGFDNYVPFVVRNDSRPADLMVQLPVTTYQAYNNFPDDGATGKSLYDFHSYGAAPTNGPSDQTRAEMVSFDRPYSGKGSGQFFTYDYPALRWMERSGYDLTYSTSIDTHTDRARILNHRGFVSLGHDEYWTLEMYDNVEMVRDHPSGDTDVAFLGANNVYWRIGLLKSPSSGLPNRVVYSQRRQNVDRWREQGRPEQQLIGVQYVAPFSFDYKPFVVAAANSFVWRGAGVSNGTALDGLVGYEVDNLDPSYPGPPAVGGQTFLAASPFQGNTHQASIYRAASGSWVFASGTLNWSWGLGAPDQPQKESAAVQIAMANVFDRFLADPPPPTTVARATTMSELMSANDYRRTTDGDVLRLYRAFFDREPDVAGARYWLNVRRNYSLIQISQFFAASEEYRIRYSGTDDREFLRRVYANVLGRSFDQSGFDYWLDVLRGTNASGQNPARGRASRGEVVRWVTASKEFTTNYPY